MVGGEGGEEVGEADGVREGEKWGNTGGREERGNLRSGREGGGGGRGCKFGIEMPCNQWIVGWEGCIVENPFVFCRKADRIPSCLQ